jgi:seipin
MYRWKLLSFFTFTSMFWSVSMISSSIVWLLLSQYWGSRVEGNRRIKGEKTEDGDTPIKEEFDEGSIKDEEDDAIKPEEIEQTANMAPPNNETEEAASIRAIHHHSDSGRGTAFDGRNILGAQRRRSHLSDFPES